MGRLRVTVLSIGLAGCHLVFPHDPARQPGELRPGEVGPPAEAFADRATSTCGTTMDPTISGTSGCRVIDIVASKSNAALAPSSGQVLLASPYLLGGIHCAPSTRTIAGP